MARHSRKKKHRSDAGPVTGIQAGTKRSAPLGPLFFLQVVTIVGAVFWIFWPALHGDWLWDDPFLISKNALVRDPAGLWKIWLEPDNLIDYFPLKVSVEWLEWHLLGNDTFGYHLNNVLLHILSALLVWRLLSKFGLRLAWLGGLIFAVHPITVESVAWISELKNTLSLPPFLLAICFFIDYEERGKRSDYFLALGLFLVALLCKTSMVMFPVVILLYAWWKRSRIRLKDFKIATPFFAVSLALGLTTVWFLHHHAMDQHGIPIGGLLSRLALAGSSMAFYFLKCIWPVGLIPVYPKWVVDPPSPWQFLPWPIFGGMIFWLWTKRATWGRHALLGLGFFLILLVPFIGFTAGTYMSFSWVMDHLLYIPLIGLIGLAVAGLEQIEKKLSRSVHYVGMGIVTVTLALMAWGSHAYAGMFVSEQTFWTYTIEQNPEAWLAYENLGYALFQAGQADEAIKQYNQAIKLKPDYAEAYNNLSNALLQVNQVPEAIKDLELAVTIDPNYAPAYSNLGNALRRANQIPEAIKDLKYAVEISPGSADAHNNLGNILAQTGKTTEAIEQFKLALEIDPDDANVHGNMGSALGQAGRITEAIEQFELAIKLNPNDADTHNNLGYALSQEGRIPEAIEQYEISLKIRPEDAAIQQCLKQLQSSHAAPAPAPAGKP
ncbi:tetratricopeptide repeat protein [Methylacidiphilales bacterium]|nr:tetratricopeptide repeat protein [Candidatus Methylacidiphilales bacterium]